MRRSEVQRNTVVGSARDVEPMNCSPGKEAAVFGMPMVDDDSFEKEVEGAEGLVLVDFTAAWCPPCRVIAPLLVELAKEYEGRLRIVSLDTDENMSTAARFGARSLPTLIFFRDGKEVDRWIGAVPIGVLRKRIERNLQPASD